MSLKRIKEAKFLLKKYNHEYYCLDDPSVTDAEYDRLFRELQKLEEKLPQHLTVDSPTQTVGCRHDEA